MRHKHALRQHPQPLPLRSLFSLMKIFPVIKKGGNATRCGNGIAASKATSPAWSVGPARSLGGGWWPLKRGTARGWKKHCGVRVETSQCLGQNIAVFGVKHRSVRAETPQCLGRDTTGLRQTTSGFSGSGSVGGSSTVVCVKMMRLNVALLCVFFKRLPGV